MSRARGGLTRRLSCAPTCFLDLWRPQQSRSHIGVTCDLSETSASRFEFSEDRSFGVERAPNETSSCTRASLSLSLPSIVPRRAGLPSLVCDQRIRARI